MNGIHIGDFSRADHRRNIEITLTQLRRTNADGFVRETHREGVAIGLAINGNRSNAQFFAGADDAQGNLAAIGYQDLLEHAKRTDGTRLCAIHHSNLRQLICAYGWRTAAGHTQPAVHFARES